MIKLIFFMSTLFMLSGVYGQSFQSAAKLVQLQVAEINPAHEGVEINPSVESSFLYQYHDPKSVEIKVKVSEKEIILISEYPKHTKVTYKVIYAKLPVDAKFTYENPVKFKCVTESGESCIVKYFLLNDMSREENRELQNADKEVMLVIHFPTNKYDYLGYLD